VEFFWLNCLKQPVRIDERPSSVNEVDSFPPWGSLDVRQGFTFLPKKMKFAEFFFRQGEALEQGKNLKQTSIGSHTLATFPKGESKRLRQRQKLKIKRYATIRYETCEACPKGKARDYIKGKN